MTYNMLILLAILYLFDFIGVFEADKNQPLTYPLSAG